VGVLAARQAGQQPLDSMVELVARHLIGTELLQVPVRLRERHGAARHQREVHADELMHQREAEQPPEILAQEVQQPVQVGGGPDRLGPKRLGQRLPVSQEPAAAQGGFAQAADRAERVIRQQLVVALEGIGVLFELVFLGLEDLLGQDGGLDAPAAVEAPGGVDGGLDELSFQVGLGPQFVSPGVESSSEFLVILSGEDGQRGAEAVLQSVEAGACLARIGFGSCRPLCVLSICLKPCLTDGWPGVGGRGVGHRCEPSMLRNDRGQRRREPGTRGVSTHPSPSCPGRQLS
jgi:hypothetical protein